MKLEDILNKYGVPDPSIVGKLPRGGITLDFVGHAEITKILIEVDPNWSWEPVAWTVDGRPAINVINGNAVMWGKLTVLEQTRLGVGTAKHDKPDLDKELIGDFLRNAAMRFGICLSLWSKSEWDDQPETGKPTLRLVPPVQDFVAKFRDACKQKGIEADEVAKLAGVDLGKLVDADHAKLRDTFKTMTAVKPIAREVEDADKLIEQVKQAFPTAETVAETPQIKDPDSPASTNQIAKIRAMLNAQGFGPMNEKIEACAEIINRPIKKMEQMTKGEASKVINSLESRV